MRKRTYDVENRPICCWLSQTQKEQFRAIAHANNVSPTALLKAVVVDVIAEEGDKSPILRRRLQRDVFSILRGDDEISVEPLVPK